MHTMPWEQVCYKILDYESKYLQIKLPIFYVFHGLRESDFLKIYIYVSKATLLIFDWNRNKYTSNSLWFYYLQNSYLIFFSFCKGIASMSHVTVPLVTSLSVYSSTYTSSLAHHSIGISQCKTTGGSTNATGTQGTR